MTQGQFLAGFNRFEFRVFIIPDWSTYQEPSLPYYLHITGMRILFPKECEMWNANSFIQDLSSGLCVHFQVFFMLSKQANKQKYFQKNVFLFFFKKMFHFDNQNYFSPKQYRRNMINYVLSLMNIRTKMWNSNACSIILVYSFLVR